MTPRPDSIEADVGRHGQPRGIVYLVGGGPGDPGLLTVAAARLLRRADVVVHDALIGQGVLDMIPESVERIDVGKRCGGRRTTQERIHEVLIEAASRHRTVVRLKGGDPFVFGRGGEEALALRAAGIRFRVVPGVTAGVGVSAYAGIPVTHRGVSAGVTFVTGHEDIGGAQSRIDWEALARVDGTLVVYMGVGTLGGVADRLIRAGKDTATPVAVIEWGTISKQRTVTSTLGEIPDVAAAEGIRSPALVVIGEVVRLRKELSWFERFPLLGRKVIVARSRPQVSRVTRALRRLGAEVIEAPRLGRVRASLDADGRTAIRTVGDFGWTVFISVASVEAFWQELSDAGLDSRAFATSRIASFGAETTKALTKRGIRPDVSARTFDVGRVPDLLAEKGSLRGARVLFPRDARLTSPIADALRASGATVQELEIYRSIREPIDDVDLETADVVIAPSSTAIRDLVASGPMGVAPLIAIGPSTAATARSLGLTVHLVAETATVGGVIRAVRTLVGDGRVPDQGNAPSVGGGSALATPLAS